MCLVTRDGKVAVPRDPVAIQLSKTEPTTYKYGRFLL
jgi:hypothetical protein